ncbi:MAG: hypothetical protein ABJE47_10380 [bacterium]
MRLRTLSLCIAAGVIAAACSDTSTGPATRPALTPPTPVAHDDLIDMNPDGTCRSGYMVSNGRCAPI